MAELFTIDSVSIGPRYLDAHVSLSVTAPVKTSDSAVARAALDRVMYVMPGLADHLCLGDSAPTFGEVARNTEFAHVLEHMTIELLSHTSAAENISTGRTTCDSSRHYTIRFACPDDVLVAGALSSALWILDWAFMGDDESMPQIDAIVAGLDQLLSQLDSDAEDAHDEVSDSEEDAADTEEDKTSAESVSANSDADFLDNNNQDMAHDNAWGLDENLRPHPVR